jgi:hypothetical protein
MNQTSNFPKMGDDGMTSLVNMSGQRSPYTMPEGRKGPGSPDLGGGGAGGRGSTMIHEAHGPQFRPVASKVYATEYAATGRNTRQVPSAVGNRDFWAARSLAGE